MNNHYHSEDYACKTKLNKKHTTLEDAVFMRYKLQQLECINPCNPPKDISQEREYQMYCNIGKFLCATGFTPSLVGFKYLRQAIFYCCLSSEAVGTKRRFYEMLELINAEFFTRIERSIRYSITMAAATGKLLKINDFFNAKVIDIAIPPCNSELIAISVEMFKMLMANDKKADSLF